MAKFRPERVSSLIQEEISRLLMRGMVKDPRVSTFLSVTKVDLTSDYTLGKVYVSSFEPSSNLEKGVSGLNSAAGFIQRELGKTLKMRNIPKLTFVVDHSIREGFEINKKIDDVVSEE